MSDDVDGKALLKKLKKAQSSLTDDNVAEFSKVAETFANIRDNPAWFKSKGYATFEEYARVEWKIMPEMVYLIDALYPPNRKPAAPPTVAASEYNLPTGQEFDAIIRAVSDGKTGANYRNLPDDFARVHQMPNAAYFTKYALTPDEIAGEMGMSELEAFTGRQDADAVFALCYVSRLLAPPAPLPPNTTAVAWIDLDDVAGKIGLRLDKLTGREREETRRHVYDFIRAGARASVHGARTSVYKDKATGKELPTRIDAPLWSITATETATLPGLFPLEDVPRRVEVTLSRQWLPLLTHPDLNQYARAGETIGAIPASQPGGAWARCIGLALFNTWRRHPADAVGGGLTFALTRRELLTRYAPKLAPVEEVLSGPNPKRAVDYWRGAIAELAARGVVAREGEAASAEAAAKGPSGAELPRQGWAEVWLDTPVILRPGAEVAANLAEIAASRYVQKPRNLAAAPGVKKRGRPPKNAGA